ncbi:MAG: outer membrane protein assembly factor BamA [Gemmatimonadaceae bacterium]
MFRFPFPGVLLAALGLAAPGAAQQAPSSVGACARPDSVIVTGNARVSESSIRSDAGLTAGAPLTYPILQRAIKALFATGQFDDVRLACESPTPARATAIVTVRERPVIASVVVTGPDAVAPSEVRDRTSDLLPGRTLNPATLARAVQRIDSLYQSRGYYLAKIHVDSQSVAGRTTIKLDIDEGHRLAISGVRVRGNSTLSTQAIVSSMQTKPEGFWWWRGGEFDEDKFAGDLGERIPGAYAARGYVDFQVLKDTLIVDRTRGKALADITVAEGPQYRVGTFEVVGNKRFSTDEVERFYPFGHDAPTLSDRVTGFVRRSRTPRGIFDRARWDDATAQLSNAYRNEGYIYASVRPIIERKRVGPDSAASVDLRWEIDEKSPAIVNRIDIIGNDYTVESCIRDQLIILPGDVFNQDRLIRSYQNIGNMGFFETPLAPPDTKPANDQGDIDVIFKVKEKRTGNINFGASVGQGTGVGGFVGLDQPNLFGLCKRGSLQWQFGAYINDFSLSYTDPAIRQSRISGTVTAYNRRSRYTIADLGRSTLTGGQLQFGFPIPSSPFTRLFVSYGGERASYGGEGLLGTVACNGCFRSTLGLTATRDTRIDLPFATAGTYQTLTSQFNGGPLGGSAAFQRFTGEFRNYVPLGSIGGDAPGSSPIKFVLGMTARAGAVFGNTGPFFYSQQFSLGGTQFGEALRGYKEFSITPAGYNPAAEQGYTARRESFGSAFLSTTIETGVRFSQMLYVDTFFDAGNIWADPRQFDPTRLFRGAGVGAALVTPLGPLGLDFGYGFDRVNSLGRLDPKWELHFKFGQFF